MLELTHTLPVNRVNHPELSLEQLWAGLMLRVMEPTLFTVGLDRADILARTDDGLRRALHFGEHVVQDTVTLVKHRSVEFVTDSTDTAPSGRLLIEVVGELGDGLKLTFSYATEFPEASSDEERGLLEMIKSAYVAADEDMIRIIREHALTVRH